MYIPEGSVGVRFVFLCYMWMILCLQPMIRVLTKDMSPKYFKDHVVQNKIWFHDVILLYVHSLF